MATAKQQYNRKKFTKEYKQKEIQKNITKRTRLKKNYFKALKEEGYAVPERETEPEQEHRKVRDLKNDKLAQSKQKFDERKQIKRDRLKQKREDKEAKRLKQLEKIKVSKAKHLEREQRSKRLTQRTRSGQPLMGPKIADLLDKIKTDDTYTN